MVSLGVIYGISQFLFLSIVLSFSTFFVNCPLLVHFFFVNYPLIVHFLSIILHFSVFLSIVLLLPTFLCLLSSNCSLLFFCQLSCDYDYPLFFVNSPPFSTIFSIVLQLSTFFVNCTSIVNFFVNCHLFVNFFGLLSSFIERTCQLFKIQELCTKGRSHN